MPKKSQAGKTVGGYKLVKILGEGSWATVYEALNLKDNKTVAIKAIERTKLRTHKKMPLLFKTEVKVLKECNNPNVIQFVQLFKNDTHIYLVTEYCNGGDLQEYLNKKKCLPQNQAVEILKQILNGFKGLHEVGAMHRDFKTQNILIHDKVYKIADLGFARQFSEYQLEKEQITKTVLGTSLTMAPQVLSSQPYSFKADIWSIGVVFFQLLFGKYPFNASSQICLLQKIKSQKVNLAGKSISENARNFIERCMTVDPIKRIGWQQIYDHPLIASKKQKTVVFKQVDPNIQDIADVNQNKKYYKQNVLKSRIPCLYDDETEQQVKQNSNLQEFELQTPAFKKPKFKQDMTEQYQKMYLAKKNSELQIFRFICDGVKQYPELRTNHNVPLFIIGKKIYFQLQDFLRAVENKNNLFQIKGQFNDFTCTTNYKNFANQLKSDSQQIFKKIKQFLSGIKITSTQIMKQYDLSRILNKNYDSLINEVARQYQKSLVEQLGQFEGKKKRLLMQIIKSMQYYQGTGEYQKEQNFRRNTMELQSMERQILAKYQKMCAH